MTPALSIRKPVAQTIAVLSVSPAEEDHFLLQDIFSSPEPDALP